MSLQEGVRGGCKQTPDTVTTFLALSCFLWLSGRAQGGRKRKEEEGRGGMRKEGEGRGRKRKKEEGASRDTMDYG